MPESIRFHLDENADPDIALALREHGIDVSTTPGKNLLSASDETQFEFIKREKRIIITHDRDFLRLASKDFNHPGIIYCPFEKYSLGKIIVHCIALHNNATAEEMKGNIEYI